MKVFATNKLTHTLQTDYGIVTNSEKPQQRTYNDLPRGLVDSGVLPVNVNDPSQLSDDAFVFLFTTCVLECRLPQFKDTKKPCCIRRYFSRFSKTRKPNDNIERLKSNIHACCDLSVDIDSMKRSLVALNRLNRLRLEQAAAMIISAIRNDASITNRVEIVCELVAELGHTLLGQSCMWLDRWRIDPGLPVEQAKLIRLVDLLRRMVSKLDVSTDNWAASDFNYVRNWTSLLPLLLRVRRCSPRNRCLFIPQWVFDEAGMKPPAEFAIWDEQGRVKPGHEPKTASEPDSNNFVLSRKAFRALQRRLLRHHRFWDAGVRLRKATSDLEADTIMQSNKFIKSQILSSNNTLVVAQYFFALQRRLHRKVVSDLNWTGFLKKGESGNILQNNPDIPTTFEQNLSKFSGQKGTPVRGLVLPQIDQCCLLMEQYVSIYGHGDRNNLVFTPEVPGGSGRGAVDDYNLLCDILKTLCKAAKEYGLAYPGRVRKFLAKDIMQQNGSFDDDAFANGRVPGWETWLAQRREAGVLQSFGYLESGEDLTMNNQ